jgi:putative tricarboxylic transport membrane protein
MWPVEDAVKTQRVADIVVGCLVALLGAFVLISSTSISESVAHRLSPRTVPFVVGGLLLICGGCLAFKSWSIRGKDFPIAWPDAEGTRTIVVTLAILAGYIALLNWLGLPLATFLYVTLATWHLNRAKWVTATVVGLIAGVISYVVFIQLLGLSFPAGFLLE